MAKRSKEPKSPIKPVFFDMTNELERGLRAHADGMDNYSRFVKERLAADMQQREKGPTEQRLDPQEIATLVQQLVQTELVGRHYLTNQEEFKSDEVSDMDQFF